MRSLILAAMIVLSPAVAHAELNRVRVGDSVWASPRLTPPAGWKDDPDAGLAEQMSVLVPDGVDPDEARAIILGAAIAVDSSRGDVPADLDDFIASQHALMLQADPAARFTEIAAMTSADGRGLRAFLFDPGATNGLNWQILVYGHENDLQMGVNHIMIMLAADSREQRDAGRPALAATVAAYVTAGQDAPE